MDAIEKCINKRSLHATLDTLPQDLDETYERILLAIPEVNRAYAKRLLIWVTYSREPQRLESLAEAAAIDPSDHDPISDDNKPRSPLDILTLCQGLIAPITSDTYGRPVSQRYQGYALSHFSVREYLESNRIRNSPARAFRLDKTKSDTFLTGACVTYLHQWQESVPLECWHEELERSDLARYCKETWLYHAQAAEPISELVLKLVITYLGTDFEYYDHTRSFHFFPETKEPEQENGPLTVKLRYRRLLKCACRTGLPSLVRLVLKTEFSCCPVRKRTRDRVTAAPLRYPVYFANLLLFEFMGLLYFSYRLWANSERVDFIILSALLTAQLLVFWHIAVESYNPKMIESDPPLQLAARSGSVPVAQALLGAGEDQRWPLYDPEVSLFEAVTRNNTDMAQYLLSNCSYRSISNTLGRAIACPISRKGRGHVTPQIARLLLRSSPGVRAASKYNETDWIARIPPHGYSGARLEVGVVPTLMHLIAVQGFFQAFDSEEKRLALSDILAYTTASSVHEPNSDGDTPLHLAAGQRCRKLLSVSLDGISKAIVQYLLQVGASPSIQNSHGATPLHLVGFVPKQGIRDELLELFAMYQANPDAPDKQGRTLLHAVACVDDGITHAMKCFPHATLDQRDSEGNTPLHFAASCGNSEGGLALLRLGADATARNHAGATPLHMLCRLGSIWRISVDSDGEKVRTAQLDLEFPWGRPTDWINNTDGRAAKLREHQNFAQKICQAGADINALDEKGNSALHWACLYWGPARMLNIFRDLGAEINRLNSQGQTPLDFIADESSEVVSERTRRWENLDAMYVENRAWLRDMGGRTAEEINVSQ
jgi:ankyrin repeat protein